MKKYIYILVLVISCTLVSAKDYNYDSEYLSCQLHGIVKFNDRLIAYGQFGLIMISDDNGENWRQKEIIPDSLLINKMKVYNNIIYGICYQKGTGKRSAIRSNDGENWQIFELDSSNYLPNIEIEDDKIYLLSTMDKIYNLKIFDLDFNLVRNFTLQTFKPINMAKYQNYVLFSNDSGKIFKLDLSNDYLDTINLSKYGKKITKYIVEKNELYVKIDTTLIKTNDLNKWEIIINSPNLLCFNNGTLYNFKINVVTDTVRTKSIFEFSEIKNGEYKLLSNSLENESYFEYFNPVQLLFSNDSIIFCIGWDKMILRSSNSGKSWKIISDLRIFFAQTIYPNWFNDSIAIGNIGKIFYKTTNSGITWRPLIPKDYLNYFRNISNINSSFVNNKGEGIFIIYTSVMNNINVLITKDYGENFEILHIKELEKDFGSGLKIYDLDSSFMVVASQYFYKNKIYEVNTIFINKLNYKTSVFRIDSNVRQIEVLTSEFKDGIIKAIANCKFIDSTNNDTLIYHCLIQSEDLGKTWSIKKGPLKRKVAYGITQYLQDADKFYINIGYKDTVYTTYSIDKTTGDYKVIKFKNEQIRFCDLRLLFGDIAVFDIIRNDKYIIKENNGEYSYYPLNFNSKIINFSSISQINDTLAYAVANNQQFYDIVKLTPAKTTSIEDKLENSDNLTLSPAYPNPASEFVTAKVSLDMLADKEHINAKAYDLMSNLVSNPEEFEITVTGNCVEIKWNCSKSLPGMYFIHINDGRSTKSVRVTISR